MVNRQAAKSKAKPAPVAAKERNPPENKKKLANGGRKRSASPAAALGREKRPRPNDVEAAIRKRHPGAASKVRGTALSLGQGDTGQLGLGESVMERTKPAAVKGIEGEVVAVVAGGMHTLCLDAGGKVWSFGCNDEGALGRKTEDDDECYVPGAVELPAKAVQISAGDSHSVALDENGKAHYWGTFRDSSGSFGLTADGAMQKLPVPLAHHLRVSKISSGTDHVALLTSQGELYTLGCAEQGQLGRVGERFVARGGRRGLGLLLTPDRVHTKNRKTAFTDVWAGSYDTLALTTDNQVLACGLNNYHQLGIAKGMLFHTLVRSIGFSDACREGWARVAFGQHHALALDPAGKVYAVGRVEYGRLGLGGKGSEDARVPTPVPKLEGVRCVDVSCGTAVSFAVTDSGECFSWGMCTNDQLGHAQGDEDAWEPVKMAGKQLEDRKVVGVSGGGQHTVVVAKDR